MNTSEKKVSGAVESRTPTQLISVNEVARRLGVCRKTVENMITRKELKKVSVRRRVLIREADIEGYIRRKLR